MNKYLNKCKCNGYLLTSFIVPVLFLSVFYSLIQIYPFGNNTILFIDMNSQYVAFFENLRSVICESGSLIYSWGRSLGGEFLGIYAYYLMSPLSYIVALFPEEKITLAIFIITLLKSGLSGATMAFYLKKTSPNTNKNITLLFSTMYAMCSYSIVYVSNTMWIDALIWLPLVIYGEEQLFNNKKYVTFIISLAMCIISNFYTGYMVCLFAVVYYFYLVFKTDDLGEYSTRRTLFTKTFMRFSIAAVIILLISCISLVPACYGLSFGKTDFSSPSWVPRIACNFKDFFKGFLVCSSNTITKDGTPYIYSGLLPILLLPTFFLSNKITKREKVSTGILLGVLVLTFFVSTFQLIIHCGQYPVWFNYRYSFILSFLVIALSHKSFYNFYNITRNKLLLICSLFLGVSVAVCLMDNNVTAIIVNGLLIIGLTLGLLLAKTNKNKIKSFGKVLVGFFVILDIVFAGMCNMALSRDLAKRQQQTDFEDMTNKMNFITEYINEHDNGFYRFEKTFLRSNNDNIQYGFRGVSGSTSTLNASALEFLKNLGYGQVQHYSQYLENAPLISDSITGIKYIASDKELVSTPYELIYQNEDKNIFIYENPYALSIGYAVNENIKNYKINKGSTCEKINALSQSLTGINDVQPFKPIEMSSPTFTKTTNVKDKVEKNYNVLTYTLSTSKIPEDVNGVYIQVDRRCDKIYVDNTEYDVGTGTINSLDILYFADIEKGKDVTVSFYVNAEDANDSNYYNYENQKIYYFDQDAFSTVYNALCKDQINITNFTETTLSGVIRNNYNKTVFTTIPYDKNFAVYIDDKPVKTYKLCDSMLAFDIDEGIHFVDIKYIPYQLYIGLALSCIGICLFFVVIVLQKRRKNFLRF